MLRATVIAAIALIMIASDPANADIYKYRDTQGFIRYTYDLAEVPEDQRPQIQTYEESSAGSKTSPQERGETAEELAKPDEEPDEEIVVDEKTIEELNQRKKELDQEFAGLMEEKYNLLKKKEKLANSLAGRDTAAVEEYDKKVGALNRKIADYQKRRDAFQEEAEALKKAVENPGS